MYFTVTRVLIPIALVVLLTFSIYKRLIHRRLSGERWLPVVNRFGRVNGKVAMSQYLNLENAPYTVPVVRIIFLYQGRFLLKEQTVAAPTKQQKTIDTPFERFIFFKEDVENAARATLAEHGESRDLQIRFLFRYYHRNKDTNRLIFLYIYNIRNEKMLEHARPQTGKWWTGRKVFENLHRGLFPDYFEKEFEFLRSTVLKTEYHSGKAKLLYQNAKNEKK
jgi:hypothetical protein